MNASLAVLCLVNSIYCIAFIAYKISITTAVDLIKFKLAYLSLFLSSLRIVL